MVRCMLALRVDPGDTVFVYFSGQAVDDGAPPLLPIDARDPLGADTGIDLSRLGRRAATPASG